MVRGLGIIGVVIFHIVWDLDMAGLIPGGLARHPAWILFARSLASTFMILVGVSLALAHRREIRWSPFVKRLLIVACAALAISVVTKIVFPDHFIYFGILHSIVVASIVGLLFLRLPVTVVAAAGLAAIILPMLVSSPLFNIRALAWIGFAAQPPPSNDYVPVFPWVGLTLLGLAATRTAIRYSADQWISRHEPDHPAAVGLAWLGRHTLAIYLIHQPVLLSLILPLARWVG
jgi:uncharacterized membrane protein